MVGCLSLSLGCVAEGVIDVARVLGREVLAMRMLAIVHLCVAFPQV